MKRINNRSAFTIIEIMVVVLIIGIISAIGYFAMGGAGAYYRLKNSANSLQQTIEYVRQYAMEKDTHYLIYFDKMESSGGESIFYVDGMDTVAVSQASFELPNNVSFGTKSGVSEAVQGGSLPGDGIDFPDNKLIAYPHEGVTGGAIYFKNSAGQRALTVNSLGSCQIHEWQNGDWHAE